MDEDCKKLIEINNTCLSAHFPDIEFRNSCVIPQPQLKFPLNGVSDCPLIDTRPGSLTFGQSNLCVCWFPIPSNGINPAPNIYLVQSSLNENFSGSSTTEQIVNAPDTELCYNLFETTGSIRDGQTIYWRVIAAHIDRDSGTGCVSLKSETRSFTITCGSDDLNKQLCERYNVQLNLQGPDFVKNCECCTFWVDGSSDCFDFAGNEILRILEPEEQLSKDTRPVDWSISPEIFDIANSEFGEGRKSVKVCPCVEDTQAVNICSTIWFETDILLEDFFLEDYENPEDAPDSDFVVFSCQACKKLTVDAATEIEQREVISDLVTTDSIKSVTTCGIPLNSNSCTDLKVNVQGIVKKYELGGCAPGFSFLPIPDCDCNCFPRNLEMVFEFTPEGSTECYRANSTGILNAGNSSELGKISYDLIRPDAPIPLLPAPQEVCDSYCFNTNTGECRELNGEPECPGGFIELSECPRLYCRDEDGNCQVACEGGDQICDPDVFASTCDGNFDQTCAAEFEEECSTGPQFPQKNGNILDCDSLTQPVSFILLDRGSISIPTINNGDLGSLTPVITPDIATNGLSGGYFCNGSAVGLEITNGNTTYRNSITIEQLLFGTTIQLFENFDNCVDQLNTTTSVEIQITPFLFSQFSSDISYNFQDLVFDDPERTTLVAPCMTLTECVPGENTDDPDSVKWDFKYCLTENCGSNPIVECGTCNACGNTPLGAGNFEYNISGAGTTNVEGNSIIGSDGNMGTAGLRINIPCTPNSASFRVFIQDEILKLSFFSFDENEVLQETVQDLVEPLICDQEIAISRSIRVRACPEGNLEDITLSIEVTIAPCNATEEENEITIACDGPLIEFNLENDAGNFSAKSVEQCNLCVNDTEVLLTTDQDIPFDKCYFDVNRQNQLTLRQNNFYGFVLEKVNDDSNCYQIFSGQECSCDNVFPIKIVIEDLEFFAPQPGAYSVKGKSFCTDCGISEYRLNLGCDEGSVNIELIEFCLGTGQSYCYTADTGNESVEVRYLTEEVPCNDLSVCSPFREFNIESCEGSRTGSMTFSNHGYIAEDVFNLLPDGVSCATDRVFVQFDQNTKNYIITNYESSESTNNVRAFCGTVDGFGEGDICGDSLEQMQDFGRENIRVICDNEECDCTSIMSQPLTICLGDGIDSGGGSGFESQTFVGPGIREYPDQFPVFSDCTGRLNTVFNLAVVCSCDEIRIEAYEACFTEQGELDLFISQGGIGNFVASAQIPLQNCGRDIDFTLLAPAGGDPNEITNIENVANLKGKIKFSAQVENCLNLCVEKDSKVWVDFDSCTRDFSLVSIAGECENRLKRGRTYTGILKSGMLEIEGDFISGGSGQPQVRETITVECPDIEMPQGSGSGSEGENDEEEYLVFVDDCCQIQCCKKKDDCECGPAGSFIEGTIIGDVLANGNGNVMIEGFDDPKPFSNTCAEDLEDSEQIDLLIREDCSLQYIECEQEDLIFFCICNQVVCFTPSELLMGVNFSLEDCYCVNGNTPGHEVTIRMTDTQMRFTIDGDDTQSTPYSGQGCGSILIMPSSGFCYEDLSIDFGTSKDCWSRCISSLGEGCDCFIVACFMGRQFEFDLYAGYEGTFKNAVCCPPEDSSTGADATDISDVTLTIEYIPEMDCETARIKVTATVCEESQDQEFDVDSRCLEISNSGIFTFGDDTYGFSFGRFFLDGGCEGSPSIEDCCGSDDEVIHCCCGEEGEKTCVTATNPSCSKLEGMIFETEDKCTEGCVNGYCCDSSEGCSPAIAAECDPEKFSTTLSGCNTLCEMVNCCDPSSGSCDLVIRAECNGEEFEDLDQCSEVCFAPHTCDPSEGCIPDLEGEFNSLGDCEEECQEGFNCNTSSGDCDQAFGGAYATEEECTQECDQCGPANCCIIDTRVLLAGEFNTSSDEERKGFSGSVSSMAGESLSASVSGFPPVLDPQGPPISINTVWNSTIILSERCQRDGDCVSGGSSCFFQGFGANIQDSYNQIQIGDEGPTSDNTTIEKTPRCDGQYRFRTIIQGLAANPDYMEGDPLGFDNVRRRLVIDIFVIYGERGRCEDCINNSPTQAVQRILNKPLSEILKMAEESVIEEGVGTEFTQILKSFKFPETKRCEEITQQMNINGVTWCEENIEDLVDDIDFNSKYPEGFQRIAESLGDSQLTNKEMIEILLVQAIDQSE